MAYNALNNLIDAYIYANGVQAITGQILNGVLKQMVAQLGSGYHLMGVAGPETVPASNDYAMAYFAATAGEYTDFGGITLAAGEVAVLLTSGNGSWEKQTIYNVPTTTEDLENTAGFITNAVTDLVNYYTKTEVDDTLAGYPTLEALATALADYYTKAEIDTILAGYTTNTALASALADYYNKNDIDGLLSVVNAALADRYTKSETDTKLADYYRKAETYDKDEVDSIVAALSRQEYIVAWDGLAAPDVSAIPAGVTVTYSGTPYTGTLAASASTVNKIYMVWNGTAYDMYGTSQDGGYSWVPMGTTSVDLSQYATKSELSQLQQEVADSMAVEILSGTYPVAASLGYIPCSFKQGKKYVVGFSWEYTSGGLAYLVVRQGSGPLVNITPNYYTSRGSEKVYFNAESDYNNLIVINYGGETASGNVTLSVKESYVSEDIKSDIDTVNGNIGTINNEISNLRQELTNDVSQFETKVDIETGKLIVNYPVVAGGSNAKDIKGNFEAGVYGVLVRNIDTQNSGTYSIYINPSSALFGLRTNCTIGIERTISLQSDATILGVEDINPSITTSGNMEIIIRRIDSNESIIERRNNIEENYSTRLFGDFINGTLGDGGAYSIYQAENRVCSISMLNYNRDIVLTAQNGVIFGIHYFDDQGTWLGDSGWISDSLTVYKNTNFKVVVNNGTNPLSIKSALDNILVTNLSNNTQTKLSVTGQGGTGILTDFQIGENRVLKFSIPEKWDITNVGSIDNNVITVGYKIGDNRVDIFQRTKRRLDSEGWPTEFFIELPSFSIDGFYIFLRVDSGKTATIYYDIYNYGKLDVPTIYQGQRIEIGMRYALSVIGRMTDYGTPSAQINAQGMAVYGDRYLIQGSNKVGVGTHFIIIDLQEKTLNTILFESQTSGQGFHMNNINLGGKYAESDILPLAYCSECYNEKTCKVVRFSNTFDSFTIIQTIKYSGTTIQEQNYMDWILDYENNKIYAFKDRDNGLDLFGFNLPTLDNNNVVLGDADIIETIRIPNTTGASLLTQGGTIINGKLWTAFGADTTTYPGLLVISDLKLQQMVSFVDLSGLGECEAVGVYEKGVLLCCASGGLNAVSLSNPAYAYMIFNV